MERIEKFQDCKIENLQNITGGNTLTSTTMDREMVFIDDDGLAYAKDVSITKNVVGKVVDKIVYNGCSTKVIDNPGLLNWLNGSRSVATYDMCAGPSPVQD